MEVKSKKSNRSTGGYPDPQLCASKSTQWRRDDSDHLHVLRLMARHQETIPLRSSILHGHEIGQDRP